MSVGREVRSPISKLIRSAGWAEHMFFPSAPRVFFFPRPRTSSWRVPATALLERYRLGHTHLSTDHTFPARPSPGANPISISPQLSPSAIRCVTAKPLSCSEHARGEQHGGHASATLLIHHRHQFSPAPLPTGLEVPGSCRGQATPPRSVRRRFAHARTPKLYSLPTHALV